MDLSVVTVVWNNVEELGPFLSSIQEQGLEGVEVIFVDNGSTDGSIEWLRQRDDVVLIENGLNAGYPAAMNRGVQEAQGDLLLLCNPDLVFRPGSLPALRDTLVASPDTGGVGPVIETPADPPELYPIQRTDLGLAYGWSFFSGLRDRFTARWANRDRTTDLEVISPDGLPVDLPWLHGCCGMFRRSALDSVGGGFDPRFFMYFEDTDLGRCLRQKGWRLQLVPEARVLHLEEQSAGLVKVKTRTYFMESWHKYLRKHRSWGYRVVAYCVVLAALGAQFALQTIKSCLGRSSLRPVYAAYLWTHLTAPWRDLERERELQVMEQELRWDPTGLGARFPHGAWQALSSDRS